MLLTNEQIYKYTRQLEEVFFHSENITYITAKVNFLINKNRVSLIQAYNAIESERQKILHHYGVEINGEIIVPPEKIEEANQELEELLSIEQEVQIILIPLSDLEKYEFTLSQMEALFFMIKED